METAIAMSDRLRSYIPPKVLIVSRHDYRSKWRANLQPLADAFYRLGSEVCFISTGYSQLSRFSTDRRRGLDSCANSWEEHNYIRCFLWKSLVHPVRFNHQGLDWAAGPLFCWWAQSACRALDDTAADANLIIVESDLSSVLLGRLRRQAPNAHIVYLASDLLETIGAAPGIGKRLFVERATIDDIVVVARAMIPRLAQLGRPITFIPHGIDPEDFETKQPSPYRVTGNVVSVGSMLFDRQAVLACAEAVPTKTIHLIGAPLGGSYPQNVVQHDTMPFRETVKWLRYADVGLAPYEERGAPEYLAESSMKLMQYGYLGLPAVCPDFAVGNFPLRFGYTPGNNTSISTALQMAFSAPLRTNVPAHTWLDVARQIAALRKC